MSPALLVLNGVSLEVRRWGESRPPRLPILLMHEGLGSIELWKDFPEALAAATEREVIAWSRQDHGLSDRSIEPRQPDYMHREAALLPKLHALLGISRAHWLGHSDGASIALIGAAQHPSLAASLVLEAPHVFVEDLTVASIAEIGARYYTSGMSKRLKRYHADPDYIFWKWHEIWLDPKFRDWNIEGLLSRIEAPALLIQGRDDEYGTMEQLERIEGVLQRTQRVELGSCGHSPHRDQPLAVIAAIARFLESKR
jgi:pimeloyl-ACP methyl ester carboxylesterase